MKFFHALIILTLICGVQSIIAQGINNLWLFGYENPNGPPTGGIKIDFSSGTPVVSSENRKINLSCTNGLIANQAGDLQFITNGAFILNAANDTMLNGTGLSPCYYTTNQISYGLNIPQAALVIPYPLQVNKYILFHGSVEDAGHTDCALNLYYSVIDMNGDNGLGEVIQKNIVLLPESLVIGRITACKHANGRDWWIICHEYNTNKFEKFLVTPYTILGPYPQSIGAIRNNNFGQNCFSPDGSKFAYYEPIQGDLDVFNFDRCTGTLSPFIHVDINDSAVGGGVVFSPSSDLLYVNSMNYVYQFNLNSPNVSTDFDTVAVYDGFYSNYPPFKTTFFLGANAPDGKIYINCSNSTTELHVINFPDSLGSACGFCQHCLPLPAYNGFTLPNYPNYFLGAETGSGCDSLIGVNEVISSIPKIKINPNPVVDQRFTVEYEPVNETRQLSIIDLEGKIMVSYNLPPWSSIQHLTLPELVKGMYLVKLDNQAVKIILYRN